MLLSHLIDVEIKASVPSNHIQFSLRTLPLRILLPFSIIVLGQPIPNCFLLFGGAEVRENKSITLKMTLFKNCLEYEC